MTHGVTIRPCEPGDLPRIWDILRVWPDFWVDKSERPETCEAFCGWWSRIAHSALVGVDDREGVIGAAYLYPLHEGQWATPHIFKRKGYANPRIIRAIVLEGLPVWFEQHGLKKLWAWSDKPAAIRLALAIGFRIEGIARCHIGDQDHYQLSLLRTEACRQNIIFNALRLLRYSLWG